MTGLASADKVTYLANVFAVCKADGTLGAEEVDVLKDVARRIGVTQEEAAAARSRVANGRYQLAILDDLHARQNNMQDMVLAALADGSIDERESGPIERLAKLARYAQADMDMIMARAQQRLEQLRKARLVTGADAARPAASPRTPPPASAPPKSRTSPPPFPQPTPLPPTPAPLQPIPLPPKPTPLPPLSRQPSPRTAPSSDEEAAAETSDAEAAEPAAAAPEPVEPAKPAPAAEARDAAPLGAVSACMRCRSVAPDPAAYCFGAGSDLNVWGCRLLGQPWRAGAAWLAAGTFRRSGCFVFDRSAIRDLLAASAGRVGACPHFSAETVERALDALPSQAWRGRRWRYRQAQQAGEPGVVLSVPDYRHGCALRVAQTVTGVEPVGDAVARRVIRDACRAAGRARPAL